MWKRILSLNLSVILVLASLPICCIPALAKDETTGYAVFYKNDGSDESESDLLGTFGSNGDLMLYERMPDFKSDSAVIVSYNSKADGSGREYIFTSTLKESYSLDEINPGLLYAQWAPVESYSIRYIATEKVADTGEDYFLIDNLSGVVELADESTFETESGKQVLGWAVDKDMDEDTAYFPGQEIEISEDMTLYAIMGVNRITFHYLDRSGDNVEETKFYNRSKAISVNAAERVSSKLFVGWNTKEDGTGDWYTQGDDVSKDTPNILYAQYKDMPDNNYYIIDGNGHKLTSGQQRDVLPLTDGKAVLPKELADEEIVAYWYSNNRQYYPAEKEVFIEDGSELTAEVVDTEKYYGIIDGNGGLTTRGSAYSATTCMVTSDGDLNVYSFSDVDSFTKDGMAVYGYEGEKTQTTYEVDADIWAAMGAEADDNNIAYFTAQYLSVTGDYIQYMGNGAKTSDGVAFYVQDGLDLEESTSTTYFENRFITPKGKYFLGWNTKQNGKGEWYEPGSQITVTENTQLYAQWGKNRVTYYDAEGESVRIKVNGDYVYGSLSHMDEKYLFEGWKTSEGEWYSSGDSIADGTVIELYESWICPQDTEGFYYILSAPKLGNGRMAQIISMNSEMETVILPETNTVGWCWIEDYECLQESGFLDEEDDILASGTEVTVESGDHLKACKAVLLVEFNENYAGYESQRTYYDLASNADLELYDVDEVFDEVPSNVEFSGWNTKSDGTGTFYDVGDWISDLICKLFGQWTAIESGNQNGSSNSSSGGGSSSGTTVTNKGDNTVVDTSSGTISQSNAEKIIDKAAKNDSEKIVIDSSKSKVILPADMVRETAEKTDADLVIETKNGSVRIPNSTLEDMETEGKITVEVTKTKVTIADKNGDLNDIGDVEVTISYSSRDKMGNVAVEVTKVDGTTEVIQNVYDGKGSVTFSVDGSVEYMIIDDYVPVENAPVEPVQPVELSFKDVRENDWFYNAIVYACANGLMSGVDADNFDPYGTTTRGMLTSILWRLEGKPDAGIAPFIDVTSNLYYADAVAWASEVGLISGYDAMTFAPEDPVTREQIVTILWRYAKYKGYDVSVGENTNILSYTDAFDISEYAIPAMQWACGDGVISGNDDGSLNTKGQAQRAHVAQMMMKFLKNTTE